DALGHGAGQQHRDDATQRVAEQREVLPAELFGSLQNVVGIVPDVVAGSWRTMIGKAVPRQIQRHDAYTVQQRCQAAEAGGVVQPAMQGYDRPPVLRAVEMRRHLQVRQAQADLLERVAHAAPRCPTGSSLQRVNRRLSSAAVSCGCSSGNMWPPGKV